MYSCEYNEIFKSGFFYRTPSVAASESSKYSTKIIFNITNALLSLINNEFF